MKKTLEQDYSYAVDSSGTLIHVDQAVREETYTCPCCGHEMVPHMGARRRWHFAHKADANCNYETYLHKVAKARIKDAFLASESFEIRYRPIHLCTSECPFGYGKRCEERAPKSFDIRKFYDICEEKVRCDGFVADLLLRSSKYPRRDPILIEIFVTHKSTEEKISSDNRIIEVKIRSEEDINKIVKSCILDGAQIGSCSRYIDKATNVVFYNFNKKCSLENSKNIVLKNKYVFGITDNGCIKYETLSCHTPVEKKFPPNYNLVISDEPINWTWAMLELNKRGVKIYNCMLCKFYKHTYMSEPICILYKRLGRPSRPNIHNAKTCKCYFIRTKTEAGEDIYTLSPGYKDRGCANRLVEKSNSDNDVSVEYRIHGKVLK